MFCSSGYTGPACGECSLLYLEVMPLQLGTGGINTSCDIACGPLCLWTSLTSQSQAIFGSGLILDKEGILCSCAWRTIIFCVQLEVSFLATVIPNLCTLVN